MDNNKTRTMAKNRIVLVKLPRLCQNEAEEREKTTQETASTAATARLHTYTRQLQNRKRQKNERPFKIDTTVNIRIGFTMSFEHFEWFHRTTDRSRKNY